LVELAALAYKNAMDEGLRMRTRESWYQKYTNAVLALNQLLKDLQYKDYEKRLKVIEESRRLRRTVMSAAVVRKRPASVAQKDRRRRNRMVLVYHRETSLSHPCGRHSPLSGFPSRRRIG
jgi:hypothetical protein